MYDSEPRRSCSIGHRTIIIIAEHKEIKCIFSFHLIYSLFDAHNCIYIYPILCQQLCFWKSFIIIVARMDMCVIDLDQTASLLRQALNFTAHVAYKGGIIMFVCRQPSLVHMTDRAAMDCGEFSYTRFILKFV